MPWHACARSGHGSVTPGSFLDGDRWSRRVARALATTLLWLASTVAKSCRRSQRRTILEHGRVLDLADDEEMVAGLDHACDLAVEIGDRIGQDCRAAVGRPLGDAVQLGFGRGRLLGKAGRQCHLIVTKKVHAEILGAGK